jgi:regulator of sirC expression with transglutaminase-like and TPR domain
MTQPVPKPMYCRPAAHQLFIQQLDKIETTQGLLMAATAISMHQLHDVDPAHVAAEVGHLAKSIRGRVRGDHRSAVLAHAHHVLFDEQRFLGNTDDYYNPHNSYIPSVLQTKRGLPIALSLLYKCVLEELGVPVTGVNAPMHFIVSVETDPAKQTRMYIDPFEGGRALTADEAVHRLEQAAGRTIVKDDRLLPSADHRAWITRMLNNLINIFGATDQKTDLAAMLELRSLLEAR